MENKFKPYYCEIVQPDKNVLFLVQFDKGSLIKLTLVYNSISGGYMGVTADAFIETMRYLLRLFPNFFEEIDYRPDVTLMKMGFEKREPTEHELFVWQKR